MIFGDWLTDEVDPVGLQKRAEMRKAQSSKSFKTTKPKRTGLRSGQESHADADPTKGELSMEDFRGEALRFAKGLLKRMV